VNAARPDGQLPYAVRYREAAPSDVRQILTSQRADPGAEPQDGRLAASLEGTHNPQQARGCAGDPSPRGEDRALP
jgi:hypothetical protein